MNFKESLEYLYGLGYELSVKKFGLENSITLLEALGNPQNNFLKVQVAGTNGKGSTCAFLESILIEAGIKVGLNTSPHLVSITERIKVDGFEISEEKFAEYITKIQEVSEKLVAEKKLGGMPTFFEHITAMAQMMFADEEVEIAILEVGLGGRFDATTATMPEVVAITPIDLDHTKTLGNTIKKIAAEKAAIIRYDTRVLSAPQRKEAENVIYGKCREVGVEPVWSKNNVRLIEDVEGVLDYLQYETVKQNYKFDLWIKGKHQRTNAALAIHIAEELQNLGFEILKDNIEFGLEKTSHAGRLEFWNGILFDGAHNVAGALALREYLEEKIDLSITMIFGAMSGKNLEEISQILFPLAENLIFTTPENPRAMKAEEIAIFVPPEFNEEKLFVFDDVSKALEKAKEIVGDGLILVTGSLYLIGEIQGFLKNADKSDGS